MQERGDKMRIAKIKNKYMYNTDMYDNGVHHYLIYYDRKNKRYNAVQLTHLYYEDEERFKQVRRGNIKIEKFKEFDVPSGVKNEIYTKNTYGKKIDLKDKKNVVKIYQRYLSKKQSNRIKQFIK